MLRGTRASARPGRTSPSRAPRRAPTPRRASFRTSPRVRVFAPLPRSRVLVLLIRSTPPRAHGTSHLRPRVPAAPVAHVRPASRNRSPLIAFAPAPLSLSPTPLYCAVLWNMRNVYGVDHLRKWLIAALSEQPLPQLGEGEAAFKTRALHLLLTCVARSPRPAPRTPVRRFARHAPAHAALVSLALSLSLSLPSRSRCLICAASSSSSSSHATRRVDNKRRYKMLLGDISKICRKKANVDELGGY